MIRISKPITRPCYKLTTRVRGPCQSGQIIQVLCYKKITQENSPGQYANNPMPCRGNANFDIFFFQLYDIATFFDVFNILSNKLPLKGRSLIIFLDQTEGVAAQ